MPDDENSDAFGGFIMVNPRSFCYKDVIRAIKAGDFYASSGPLITSLMIEDDIVKIEFSDAVSANLITRGRRTDQKSATNGKTINYAEFPLEESDGYFRITVTDKSGKKAYTQVYEV